MSTTTPNLIRRHEADMIRRAERAIRAANDPWFGKVRCAGEMSRAKSKAGRNRSAARGRSYKGEW